MTNNNTISINYSDEKLRILVEKYITQQRKGFSFQGLCSYILYWAMEDGKATQEGSTLFEGNAIKDSDQKRGYGILETIIADGRLAKDAGHYQLVNCP